ncbi:MAG: tail fiber domain-containing protein [Lewinellaceae bacterium]|nr:tail fiber domain-containing protein [Lewinellaceae bacterium]
MRPLYPVAFLFLLVPAFAGAQAISINTDSSNPDPSAILDVKSTDKGMLVPRMNTAQRELIAAPATGLLVFDTTTGGFWFYNGTTWISLSGGGTYTAGPGISIVGSTISNTGDTNASNDITIGSIAGGSLSGTYPYPAIATGAVGTDELATNSITSFKIADGAVTGDDIAPTTITAVNLATHSITTAKINADAITSIKIADGTITSADIANSTIAAADLGQMGASTGQVLKWNGATWVPQQDEAGGDDWGNQAAATSLNIVGDGTTGNPLHIAQLGATNGQVLSWNPVINLWAPADDTWGTQTVITGAALSGNGTAVNPLTLDPQGAAIGQVLKWSGTSWLPQNEIVGDNWGAQVATTTPTLHGDGTAANPLNIAQQGATTGQVLQWNGAAWIPANSVNTLLQDTDADTRIQVEKSPDEDILRMDLAGSERLVLTRNTVGGRTMLEWPNNAGNIFIGTAAGNSTDSSASHNTALGVAALHHLTSQSNLVAVGDSALFNNGTDATDIYQAAKNTAIGSKSLFSNTTGSYNTAAGYRALFSNTYGEYNTATGTETLQSNRTGSRNTADGYRALYSNTEGNGNTAIGNEVLYSNTLGSRNTSLGHQAMLYNINGEYNTAGGYQALHYNSSGSNNVAHGAIALHYNTGGSDNTATGYGALYFNTNGSENAAYGYRAMLLNTTGIANAANGAWALANNMAGNNNSASGQSALYSNYYGHNNTASGSNALYTNTIGNLNTALGYQADVAASDLENATAIGARALAGANNCLVLGSINGINGATDNVKVGIGMTIPSHVLTVKSSDAETMRLLGPTSFFEYGARLNFGDGDYVYIEETSDDTLRIQANAVGIGRSPITNMLEVEGTASKSTAGDWLANSDARLKKNISPLNSHEMLDKLLALQGVTYEWNDDKTDSKRPEGVQYGFTAQNIQTVFPTLVEEDKLGYLQTAYGTYDAMTVEAIRALHDEIKALKSENARQKTENAEMKTQLDKITAALQTAGIGVGN